MKKLRIYRFTPIFVALGMVLGILVGSFYTSHFAGRRLNVVNASSDKLNSLLHIIDDQYVDSVNISELVEKALPEILRQLDPHSTYIPASEVDASMQELRGGFSGVGIQFILYQDTACVVRILPGGPSDGVGLKAGDRIVAVDDKPFTGKEINEEKVRTTLKGETGSIVKIKVKRPGHNGLLTYNIERGNVPISTVDAAFILEGHTGYIRISSFGETTYPEFLAALATLNEHDFESLIIDLRGNTGGYMSAAIQIANEFLPKNGLIVYTEGRQSPREEYTSDGRGSYQNMPLVILTDEISASASEILAGAIQDNDRGMIIGRRSFGKGLVQVPIEFSDGSQLRLTKARYYSPSGRCVQKPYTQGKGKDYDNELMTRIAHGELYSADSIKSTGKKFLTRIGRPVYDGGGIMPDIFVPSDTTGYTSYYEEANLRGLLSLFTFHYTDRHRKTLNGHNDFQSTVTWLEKQNLVNAFADYAEANGLKKRPRMIRTSYNVIQRYIITGILRDLYSPEKAIIYSAQSDVTIQRASRVIKEGHAFPQPPTAK